MDKQLSCLPLISKDTSGAKFGGSTVKVWINGGELRRRRRKRRNERRRLEQMRREEGERGDFAL